MEPPVEAEPVNRLAAHAGNGPPEAVAVDDAAERHGDEEQRLAEDVQHLVRRLGSRNRRIRKAAEYQLKQMGPAVVVPLLPHLEGIARKTLYRRLADIGIRILLPFAGLFVADALDIHLGGYRGLVLWLIASITSALLVTELRAEKGCVRVIALFEDPRAVGPLIEALDLKEGEATRTARDALVRLLPRLNWDDLARLNATQVGCLHRAIIESPYLELVHALVATAERLQDAGALSAVGKLAAGVGKTGGIQSVRDQARECLPVLRAAVERERESQTLLRAASSVSPSEVLLRAPQEAPTDTCRLVRPVLNGEPEGQAAA